MKRFCILALFAAVGGAGVAWLSAAHSGSAPAVAAITHDAPAYNGQRSFAQPVRENPLGQKRPTARAFLGAPPPMPHRFMGDRDGRACLECHARETRIEKRQQAIAPVPHTEFKRQIAAVARAQRMGPPEWR